mmetsp:Transcript_37115/g.58014  ORF Transcript_37115/g.58014 Transcript_37115/m.58014 type:complete len:84 (-) Transcript_37115:77-328(-)
MWFTPARATAGVGGMKKAKSSANFHRRVGVVSDTIITRQSGGEPTESRVPEEWVVRPLCIQQSCELAASVETGALVPSNWLRA